MKKSIGLFLMTSVLLCAVNVLGQETPIYSSDPNNDEIGSKTVAYFTKLFEAMGTAAQQDPTYDNYREIF